MTYDIRAEKIEVFGKSQQTTLIIVLLGVVIYFIHGYREEAKKINSDSKKVCGEFIEFKVIEDGKTDRNKYVTYFYIKSAEKVYQFTRYGNIFKDLFSPYDKKTQAIFYKVKKHDLLCVTYSLEYNETTYSYSPYVIKVERIN